MIKYQFTYATSVFGFRERESWEPIRKFFRKSGSWSSDTLGGCNEGYRIYHDQVDPIYPGILRYNADRTDKF